MDGLCPRDSVTNQDCRQFLRIDNDPVARDGSRPSHACVNPVFGQLRATADRVMDPPGQNPPNRRRKAAQRVAPPIQYTRHPMRFDDPDKGLR
jgi:hypothetical protein